MNAGDPIWYRQTIRGGYGYEWDVPGTFVRATSQRVKIRVLLKSGAPREIAVLPVAIRPRDPEKALEDR